VKHDEWLDACRAAVAGVERALVELPTRAEREPVVGAGRGGDDTTAVDAAAEEAILARLDAAFPNATILSEELGERPGSGALRVVVDPIDGSFNAKRGIPFFSVSIAVAEGDAMDDVVFGFVRDLGTGEEWTAEKGEGAFLDGRLLGAVRPKERLEILSLEATVTRLVAERAPAFVGLADRVRIMGSLAISLCHLAAGRVDAVCSLKPARSVDIAAAQLLVRECGLAIELVDVDEPFGRAPLDLGARSRVAAAGSGVLCRLVEDALRR
jgi:myo-inositol-1(or 4)-monophosphatase